MDAKCCICVFVCEQLDNVVVRDVAAEDQADGSLFSSCAPWLATQSECADLHFVEAPLS